MEHLPSTDFDVILVGGGLASGIVARRLRRADPDLTIAIIEGGDRLGGNHTWSFHESDVTPAQHKILDDFISSRWDRQQVLFPKRERTLKTGYRSIFAEQFDRVLRADDGLRIYENAKAEHVTATSIRLASGHELSARVVFDGRGAVASPHMSLGFQKFLGQEVEFDLPHGLDAPIIMDATVPQTDGYRFVYVLPFTATTALIEDTYYADGFEMNAESLRRGIGQYAATRGWSIKRVIREEEGVLPIVLEGDQQAYWDQIAPGGVPIGLRAGLFHPVTGYSVPDAAAVADIVAATPLTPAAQLSAAGEYAADRWRSHSFYRLLNRMLFRAAVPEQRYIVLERFYGLPSALIERFYAGNNTMADKCRILAGKPPVPISAALKVLQPSGQRTKVEEGLLG